MVLSSFILSDIILYLCSIWCIVWAISKVTPKHQTPNPLGIPRTNQILTSANLNDFPFHPVVLFPLVRGGDENSHELIPDYSVLDLTKKIDDFDWIIPKEEQSRFRKNRKKQSQPGFSVGRFDENRPMMYSSELFTKGSNPRTLHVGIDLGGPVGTKVYAFADGVIEHVGYNEALGDYGHVVVVKHHFHALNNSTTYVWALYGHLDAKSTSGKRVGNKIKRGQALGRMGDVHENGGWRDPHVHFQLSMIRPATHDMPGVLAMKDRSWALLQYPDPRIILGPLY
jgi:murein DD-endopeptidase MepM/ murein hydrolase activator NlpD